LGLGARPGPALGPVDLLADPVLVEALECATAGRALVVLAVPLVVTPGQLVEHVRAHPHRLVLPRLVQLAQPQQVVHHRRLPEAGAGPLAPLVQHQPTWRPGW
ncbi:hypothetical protein RZS08_63295, partial [Arthrospira platensis SPKY1]|nr:hypothetical protein [Arthrospira platensis SPKY1]